MRSINPATPILPKRPLLALAVATLLQIAGACGLDRAGARWETNVLPRNVCPGDPVTVSWNTGETRRGCLEGSGLGDDRCPDPIRVHIISTSGFDLDTSEQSGSSEVTVSENTTFQFFARDDDDEMERVSHAVNVVLPDRETVVQETFVGSCAASGPGWAPADLGVGTFRSELVRLVRVCNPQSFSVSLSLAFDVSFLRFTLTPGACTEDIDPALGYTVSQASAGPMDVFVPLPSDCSPTRSDPPADFDLTFFLACGETTSEPVESAPGEPAPTSSLIPVITDTPTPTAPSAVLRQAANCRTGPGTVYDVTTALPAGERLDVIGQSMTEPKWWLVVVPDESSPCWISDNLVDLAGDPSIPPPVLAPPTPTPLPQGCLYYDANQSVTCYPIDVCPVPFEQALGACTP